MKRIFLIILLMSGAIAQSAEIKPNSRLLTLEPNQWVKIHEQKKGDTVRFMRQAHGGSCFDTKRCRLVLFGSNTHSRDWKNNLFFFDPVKTEWTASYPEDPKGTYTVTEKGIPVAGKNNDHPWATHTFGTVVYDPKRDEMIVGCYPGHMRPDKWGKAVRHLWPSIKKHPTWTYRFAEKKWHALACKAVHFFPCSAAWDTDRNVMVAHRPGRIYELSGDPRQWKQVASGKTLPGWGHDNCVYDSKNKNVIIFGSNKNTNTIAVYDPAKKKVSVMPTPGPRPPRDQHNPMAFEPEAGVTVIVVDRTKKKDNAEKDTAETWLYDAAKDSWMKIKTATLPFACGMNYAMEYDPFHKVLLLVTGTYGRPTRVWALKVKSE